MPRHPDATVRYKRTVDDENNSLRSVHLIIILLMLSIMVTILREPTSYTLRFDDSTDHRKNSVYQSLIEDRLGARLRELLSLSEDEIQGIIVSLKARSPYIQYYPVSEATYERVFG